MLTQKIAQFSKADFAAEVRAGLTKTGQKELPSKYLYDELGSALFEVISVLPEYGLTRADERILRASSDEIVRRLPGPVEIAELGSGSGRKTRWILRSLAGRQISRYYPIDISRAALARCREDLGRVPGVQVDPIEADY